jgi:hypothetical protein
MRADRDDSLRSFSRLHENKEVGERGVHPPGNSHERQNKGLAAKGVCMNVKTKDEYFAQRDAGPQAWGNRITGLRQGPGRQN